MRSCAVSSSSPAFEISNHWSGIEERGYYALIWFGQGEVALVKLPRTSLVSNGLFQRHDFRNIFGFDDSALVTQVNDSRGRRWRIRAKDNATRFIDPKENVSTLF